MFLVYIYVYAYVIGVEAFYTNLQWHYEVKPDGYFQLSVGSRNVQDSEDDLWASNSKPFNWPIELTDPKNSTAYLYKSVTLLSFCNY